MISLRSASRVDSYRPCWLSASRNCSKDKLLFCAIVPSASFNSLSSTRTPARAAICICRCSMMIWSSTCLRSSASGGLGPVAAASCSSICTQRSSNSLLSTTSSSTMATTLSTAAGCACTNAGAIMHSTLMQSAAALGTSAAARVMRSVASLPELILYIVSFPISADAIVQYAGDIAAEQTAKAF